MNCCRRTLLINAKSRGCVKTVLSVRLTFADSNGPLCPSKRTDQGGDRRSAMRTELPVIALGLKCYFCLSKSFRPSSVQLAKRTPSCSQVTSPCSANTSRASSPELIAMLSRTPSSRRRYCSVIQAKALSAFCSASIPEEVACWATCRDPVMVLPESGLVMDRRYHAGD